MSDPNRVWEMAANISTTSNLNAAFRAVGNDPAARRAVLAGAAAAIDKYCGEPTPAMLLAGSNALHTYDRAEDGTEMAGLVWKAMQAARFTEGK